MYQQDAEMIIEDALTWYGDKASRGCVQRATGLVSCGVGVVWIIPTFGTPAHIQVAVKDVMTLVQQALDVLKGHDLPPDFEGRAITFVNQCAILVAMCED